MMFDRQMPFSLEAEQAVLGSVLIDPAAMDEVSEIIGREDFHLPEHGEIFSAMREMYGRSRSIDVVLLLDELVRQGTYNAAGGEAYVRVLAEAVPVASHAAEYAAIVRDKSALRRVIAISEAMADAAYSGEEAAETVIERAEELVWGLGEKREKTGFTHIRDAIVQVYNRLHEIQTNPGKAMGMPTGFGGLDNVLVGMTGGDLVLVGARPGMGKTAFAMNIAALAAKKKAVCVFSLEMSASQLADRLICSEAQVDSRTMRSGNLSKDAWEAIAHTAADMAGMNLLIDDSPGITVSGMRSKLRRVKDLGLVVVDYLQLMQTEKRSENRVLEVAEISRGLKLLAKEMDVPIICCAQLSRAVEQRSEKRPMLSDLRDSGAIEQDADVVLFLYRDGYYTGNEERSVAEVIVAKNRHGSQGSVKLGWIGQYTKFLDLERR